MRRFLLVVWSFLRRFPCVLASRPDSSLCRPYGAWDYGLASSTGLTPWAISAPPPSGVQQQAYPRGPTLCGPSSIVTRILLKQRVNELPRIELRQVVQLLARAHIADRQAQFAGDSEDDASFGRAVQLGYRHVGHVGHLGEDLGLLEAVLSR